MNKEEKIKLLSIIRDKILPLKDMRSGSPEFKAWLSQSELIISKIFNNEPEYVEKFKSINYSLPVFASGVSRDRFQEAYVRALNEAYFLIESYIENIEIFESNNSENINSELKKSNKIFLVHGRDNETKLEIARYLEKLNLQPIILHEQANEGKTIIEKIETHTDVKYAVVLYTPCDVGRLKGSSSEELKDRARQNVVFEHGYLIGKIGRSRVAALVKDNVETPNDISGVVYISMNNNWQIDLARELKVAGYEIDFNILL